MHPAGRSVRFSARIVGIDAPGVVSTGLAFAAPVYEPTRYLDCRGSARGRREESLRSTETAYRRTSDAARLGRFVDDQGTSACIGPIQGSYCAFSFAVVGHFDEAACTCLSRVPSGDERHA